MFSKINIFSLHNFLWFAALTPIYGYISVYAEHYANISFSQYGTLNMVLPFVTIGAKLFFCSLADRKRAYRSFFIWSIIGALIGYGAFGILPFFLKPQPKEQGLNYLFWILICIMAAVSTISAGVVTCLTDAFVINSSRRNKSSYGFIRVWGTLGWGFGSLAIAFINQTDKLPLLVPGILLTIVLLVIDIVAQILWPDDEDYHLDKSSTDIGSDDMMTALEDVEESKSHSTTRPIEASSKVNYGSTRTTSKIEMSSDDSLNCAGKNTSDLKIQWLLFKEVVQRRNSLYRYMILFVISGALISLQWSYFFLFLKNIHPEDFSFITGLSMIGQSMLGELPFFVLSEIIINAIGRSHTLSLSIMSIGVRFLLYEYLLPNSSMYFVLLTEAFQGPNFGLFYVVLAEVGLDYSDCDEAIIKLVKDGYVENKPIQIQQMRLALRATMQSLMSSCYEGLGIGLGSLIGGIILDSYGFSQLWLWASVFAIFIGFLNFMIESLQLPILLDKRTNSTDINSTPVS